MVSRFVDRVSSDGENVTKWPVSMNDFIIFAIITLFGSLLGGVIGSILAIRLVVQYMVY